MCLISVKHEETKKEWRSDMSNNDLNKVMLTGNLTRDPELRVTPAGTSILSFGIAVNDRRRNSQTQEWESYTNFFNCSVFGKRAEALAKILKKGMKAALDGKLHYSSKEGDDGIRRVYIGVNVEDVVILSPKSQTDAAASAPVAQGNPQAGQMAPVYEQVSAPVPAPAYTDEDIVF